MRVVREPPSLSVRALYNAPTKSVASYLTALRVVRVCAVLAWPDGGARTAGWLLEGRVRHDAIPGAEWAAWEPVSAEPLDADCTSFVHELRPGLTYSFRLAALSDLNGQEPFSDPTPPVASLGTGGQADDISGCYVPHAAEIEAAAVERAASDKRGAEKRGKGVSSMADDDGRMPWDSAGMSRPPMTCLRTTHAPTEYACAHMIA